MATKLSEGDTISMTGEVTLVRDCGTVRHRPLARLRRPGDHARRTPVAGREKKAVPGRRRPLYDVSD